MHSGWSPLRVAWLALLVVSTLYTFFWDVCVDWGLFTSQDPAAPLLRRQRLYPSKAFYYCAILLNLCLRFLWLATILPFTVTRFLADHKQRWLLPLICGAELVRRFQWALLRVENEQISNQEHFRESTWVPLVFHSYQSSRGSLQPTRHRPKQRRQHSLGVIVEIVVMCVILLVVSMLLSATATWT